jgi:hypothetical protein
MSHAEEVAVVEVDSRFVAADFWNFDAWKERSWGSAI